MHILLLTMLPNVFYTINVITIEKLTPLYNKMAFSRPPIQKNGIFDTPYTKHDVHP